MNDYEPNLGGKILHCKRSDGYEEWAQYDKKGRLIHKNLLMEKNFGLNIIPKEEKAKKSISVAKKLSIDMIRQET